MQIKISRAYISKPLKKIKFIYDKTSKRRPAWIWVKGLPKHSVFIRTKLGNRKQFYRRYLSLKITLFLPIDYTKEEMKKFYDKLSEIYDGLVEKNNLPATNFVFKKVKFPKNSKILDIGGGSGISAIPFVKAGHAVTIVDYSKGMISKAKQRKELENCKFILEDVRKLKLREKYDAVVSIFSFASNSYYNETEMKNLWERVYKLLNSNGRLILLGYYYEPSLKLFKKLKSGNYFIGEGKHKVPWIICTKKPK